MEAPATSFPQSRSAADDPATVVALGIMAATLAALCHETLGHAMACTAAGGQVRLLTSIWFRCSKDLAIIDVSGPIGNLLAGCLAVLLLRYTRPAPRLRLLLLMMGALNLFWFMGQLAFESATNAHEDWFATASQVGWPPAWRIVGAVSGVAGYILARRWLSAAAATAGVARAGPIRLAYAAAAASALIAGLLWQAQPIRSAVEDLLCVGVAPFGLLRIARIAGQAAAHDRLADQITRSWIWIAASVVAFGAFLALQATGVGPMARTTHSPIAYNLAVGLRPTVGGEETGPRD